MAGTGRSAVAERAMVAARAGRVPRGLTGVLLLAAAVVGQAPPILVRVPLLDSTNPGPSMAHDEARGRTVLVGNPGTWEWNGNFWMPMHPASQPQVAGGWSWLAFDSVRSRVILVSSRGTGVETWEWDGIDWMQRNPAHSPPSRNFSAVAFDRARGRLVLFGGQVGSPSCSTFPSGDTWEWDGLDWQQATPVVSPQSRVYHAMAYDEVSQRVVLFGGQACPWAWPAPWLRDTWEWDGSNWTQRFPAVSPPVFVGLHHMTYDARRQRVVLVGDSSYTVQTWEWDGSTWTQLFPTGGPLLGAPGAALAHDRTHGELVRFGGWDRAPNTQRSETWTLSGAVWTRKAVGSAPSDGQRMVVWDSSRGRMLISAGGSQTSRIELYEWDGATTTLRPAANAPPGRADSAMVYDRARQRAVMFGGYSHYNGSVLAETWEWDGTAWFHRTPPQQPAPRRGHAMAYDPLRQRVVLFGGHNNAGAFFGDTWTWDGISWAQVVTSPPPPPRRNHAMAFDGSTQRVLLFGGANQVTSFADTWLWDGSAWSQARPAVSPQAGIGGAMAFDALRQRLVLFFGVATGAWEWDGSAWAFLATAGPSGYWPRGVAYDEGRQHLFQFGESANGGAGIWRYGLLQPAVVQPIGPGCAGSAGMPELVSTLPYPGSPAVAIDLHHAPPGAPCLFGFSFGTQNLPLGGGCLLFLQNPIEPVFTLANAAGFANITPSVPDNLALRGLSIYVQAVALDPQGPAFGLVFSNGLGLVVGD